MLPRQKGAWENMTFDPRPPQALTLPLTVAAVTHSLDCLLHFTTTLSLPLLLQQGGQSLPQILLDTRGLLWDRKEQQMTEHS